MDVSELMEGRVWLDIDKIVFRKCTLEWHMQPNITAMDNLTYVYGGEISYTVRGEAARLGPGDLVYVPRGTLRRAETPSWNLARLFSFDFGVMDGQGRPVALPLETFSHVGLRQDLVLLCRQCCNEWIRQQPGYRLKANSYMMQLLHGLVPRGMARLEPQCRDKRIQGIMAYVLEHADENVRLQDFAQEMHLTSAYLGALFKREANESFNQYLMECRLNRAEDLLDSGQYTALEVMLLCGFNDFSYFSRSFKRRFGVPPGQYMRQDRAVPIPPEE